MIIKVVKIGLVTAGGLVLLGGLAFGTDAASYLFSSARSVRAAVKDQVPIEFELRRARDMLGEMIPEMQANIRLIAQEEVEVATLNAEILRAGGSLADEQKRITRLRDLLGTQQVSYTLGHLDYTREQVKAELARSFDRFKEAEVVLSGKRRLLDTREKSLQAAMQMLDRTRTQKAGLQDQIASLESQHRLIRAAAVGSHLQLDHSKLAQTERLIGDIKKRLDVAERVLAHEARFVEPIEIDVISEQDLLAEVDEHLSNRAGASESNESLALSRAEQTH